VLCVTDDPREAASLGDRLCLMREGRAVRLTRTATCHSASKFVEDLVEESIGNGPAN